MKKILVTGAVGRIGAQIVRDLIDRGYKVRSFVLKGDPQIKKLKGMKTEVIKGDITDLNSVTKAVEGMDAVIHTAAVMEDRPDWMTDARQFQINVNGTLNVCLAISQNLKKVKRLVAFSSTASYDVFSTKEMPIRETTVRRPISFYGISKVCVDELVMSCRHMYGFEVVVLKPNYCMTGTEIFSPYRVGCVRDVLKLFAGNPKTNMHNPRIKKPLEPLRPFARKSSTLAIPRLPDGSSWTWHPVDIHDMVDATYLALTRKKADGEIFNIAAGERHDWDKVVKEISRVTGEQYIEVPVKNKSCFYFDITKAKKILGYKPKYTVKKMVDSMYRHSQGEDMGYIDAKI